MRKMKLLPSEDEPKQKLNRRPINVAIYFVVFWHCFVLYFFSFPFCYVIFYLFAKATLSPKLSKSGFRTTS